MKTENYELRTWAVALFVLIYLAYAVLMHAAVLSFHRMDENLAKADRILEEMKKKDAIRDTWMREHQSDLMKRIEERNQ